MVNLTHHRLSLCSSCFLEWYHQRLKEVIKRNRMFLPREKLLVAVSGGKDSLALWWALVRLGYQTDGLFINLGIEKGNYSSLSLEKAGECASRLKRKLWVIDLKEETGKTLPELKRLTPRPICSLCGLVKRYYMNRYARAKGYKVILTGHNLDDEASFLLSNLLSWKLDYLSRQRPLRKERKGFVRKVSPLFVFTEKEDALYCLINKIDWIKEECPYTEGATSIFYKEILNEIEEKSPGTKLRFYQEFLHSLLPLLKESEPELSPCPLCGEYTSSQGLCAFCRVWRSS